MSNKFLGINSINVLKKYIDDQILINEENARLITLQAYKYTANNEDNSHNRPTRPSGGAFNPETAQIVYPSGWSPMHQVVDNLGENIDEKLLNGAIWMSVGVAEGNNEFANWSAPVKVTAQDGENGVDGISVDFRWTTDPDSTDIDSMSTRPLSSKELKKDVYVFTKLSTEGEWLPSIWSIYVEDASDVYYRYCVTETEEVPSAPISDTDPDWWTAPAGHVSAKKPYMWMSSKRVKASNESSTEWSTPILFSHYGQDGATGEAGYSPDYKVTLYKLGEGDSGFVTPDAPIRVESNKLDEFRAANPTWLNLPIEPTPSISEDAVYVTSESELNDNLVDGAIIALDADLEIASPIIITEGDITIELNGHKIVAGTFLESGGNVLEGDTDSYVFWVKGGHLTIQGNGVVEATDKRDETTGEMLTGYSMAVWCQGGNVTINGGEYHNGGESCSLIYASATGHIVIKDGTFIANHIGEQIGTGDEYTALNLKDRDNMTCSIKAEGGKYYKFDPAHNLAEDNAEWWEANPNGFVADNHISILVDDYYVVTPKEAPIKIWWQCVVNVTGGTNEITDISDVCRYNAVDGNAKPGQYTKYEFYWSDTQNIPDDLTDAVWSDTPIYDATNQDGSLWMRLTDVKYDNNGQLVLIKPWSDPIKLTGPRGPIGYDYRIETRYNRGTETKPESLPTNTIWYKNAPEVNTKYPYIWAKNYLVLYKMKYDNNGDVIVDNEAGFTIIEEYNHFRLSGINGIDGNKRNSLIYSTEGLDITSFSENNLYVSNTDVDVMYNIKLDQLGFINGYTGKFANIGTGKVTIKAGSFKFIGSCTESDVIELLPQESIELVCYNNGDSKELLVIGKALA